MISGCLAACIYLKASLFCRPSPLTQAIKDPPAMQEMRVRSLGWEDSPGGENGNPLWYY